MNEDEDFPSKNKYRARRRQLLEKTKAKAKRLIKTFGWPKESVKLAEHLQFCNCMMCRNPRTYEGDSIQERRQKQAENDDV